MNNSSPLAAETKREYHWYRPTISHLLYAVALLGASLATFGTRGIAVGAALVLMWAYVYSHPLRPQALKHVAILLVIVMAVAVLTPAPRRLFDPTLAPDRMCQNNLKSIMLSLHNYHDTYGSFPPAYTTDMQGKPMLSWRVLLMEFEYSPMKGILPFRIEEPWDSPHNLKLAQDFQPEWSHCSSHKQPGPNHTSYFAVVGPNTMWPGSQSRSLNDVTDGTEFTLMIVEDHSRSVLWTEPTDLTVEEAVELLSNTDREEPHAYAPVFFALKWTNGGFVGGDVRSIRAGAAPEDIAAMLSIDQGSQAPHAALERSLYQPKEPGIIDRLVQGLVLLVVALLPLGWVWRDMKPKQHESTAES